MLICLTLHTLASSLNDTTRLPAPNSVLHIVMESLVATFSHIFIKGPWTPPLTPAPRLLLHPQTNFIKFRIKTL